MSAPNGSGRDSRKEAAAAARPPGSSAPSAHRPSRIPPWRGRPEIGTRIDAPYRVTRILGEGAMGIVALARDEQLERDVATKFIHPDYVTSDQAHDRFVDEARTMARVRHENVVEIYAFGRHADAPYFVMEYIPGTTADAWMRANKELAIDEVLGVLDQLCRGVSAIHHAGAVHRDHKPTNILIGPSFRVAVADLGLARALDRIGSHLDRDTVSGTPAYMAPEIVTGRALPRSMHDRADVYSLGVLAFELFTGRLPFETDDALEMMAHHAEDEPPVPSELRADLPAAFDAVILRALDKDPFQRIPSADAFRRALLEARETSRHTQSARRFVIADGDEDFRALVAATLDWAFPGAEIVSVSDGEEALRAIEQKPTSLAILDLGMPRMNGIELTALLRASASTARLPILVVTATGGAPDWRLLSSLGADGFLLKPIDPMSLVALARKTLQHR